MGFTDRFTTRADAYVRGRPPYPAEAIDAIVAGLGSPSDLFVADLGAGTGISSRTIASRGPRVLAVEPNRAMRAAATPDPRVTWIDAAAEHTTLGERSVDAVSACQAWHWFDRPAVVAEARRILRPGGVLAIVYNERDPGDPFTRAYGDIVRRYATEPTETRRAEALAQALAIDPERTERLEFRNAHELDRDGVHARAASTSYLPQHGPEADAVNAEIAALLDRFATGPLRMHLVTTVVRVALKGTDDR